MRGDVVRDEDRVYEVIWDGSRRGDDSHLFNPPAFPDERPEDRAVSFKGFDPDEPARIMAIRTKQSEAAAKDRAAVLRLLKHRSRWLVSELRVAAQLPGRNPDRRFWSALARLRELGITQHPKPGIVELVQSDEQAA